MVGRIGRTLADSTIDPNTLVVVVLRGHRHDERALASVLDSPAGNIAMVGSHRKVEIVFRDLNRDGSTARQLQRVHAPMGLSIYVVSVVARLVEVAAMQRSRAHRAPPTNRQKRDWNGTNNATIGLPREARPVREISLSARHLAASLKSE